MPGTETKAPRVATPALAIFGVIFAIAGLSIFYWTNRPFATSWDAGLYVRALEYWHAGGDPYLRDQNPATQVLANFYVYPPIFLIVFHWLAAAPALMKTGYAIFYLSGVGLLLWTGFQMARFAEVEPWALVPLVLFFPDFEQGHHLLSGNIGIPICGVLVFLAWRAFRGRSWLPFYVVLFLAACIKGPILVLAVVPFFVARRQLLPAAATVAATLLVYAAQAKLLPRLFHEYLVSLNIELRLNGDTGYSFAGLATHLSISQRMPLFLPLVAACTAGFLLLVCWQVADRSAVAQQSPIAWFCFVWLSAQMMNPRMQPYDGLGTFWPAVILLWFALPNRLSRLIFLTGAAAMLLFTFRHHSYTGRCVLIWSIYVSALAWIWTFNCPKAEPADRAVAIDISPPATNSSWLFSLAIDTADKYVRPY